MKKITTTGSIKLELRVDDKLFDEIIKHKWVTGGDGTKLTTFEP